MICSAELLDRPKPTPRIEELVPEGDGHLTVGVLRLKRDNQDVSIPVQPGDRPAAFMNTLDITSV